MSANPSRPEDKTKDIRDTATRSADSAAAPSDDNDDAEEGDEEEAEEDGEDDDEPKLKYAKLTGSLANVYRNGDFTTACGVWGDKMTIGTGNGSIHVLAVPTLQSLRTYKAHSASVTSVSVSPIPPPPVLVRSETGSAAMLSAPSTVKTAHPLARTSTSTSSPRAPRSQRPDVPPTPNNQIYIATSSQDGHVCVQSLSDPQDVQLRNFARPLNAVALSPDYKNDRTYLSGGLAGKLILTIGGKAGVSIDANTNSAAAAASGWLGSIGLGSNNGTDTILHSGEGAISNIKWSLTGKWVVWVNEEGIKIMRSHLKLGSEHQEDAWKRVAHAGRPHRQTWADMAGVWKARCDWVDDQSLESDDLATGSGAEQHTNGVNGTSSATQTIKGKKQVEKLVVGWGDTAWLLHVQSGSSTPSSPNAKRQVGSADIIYKLQFRDCVVSGISLYTPSLLAVLAYRTRDDNDKPIAASAAAAGQDPGTPSKQGRQGRSHRHTGLAPHLRLITVTSGEEVELDELAVSRYETLSSQDYFLGSLYMPPPLPEKATRQEPGKLGELWNVTRDAAVTSGGYATRMFSSSASVFSVGSGGKDANGRAMSFVSSGRQGSGKDVTPTPELTRNLDAHPYALEPGLKLFIHSPFDCVLAVKRELSDHLDWLLEHEQYGDAWTLIDEHPEAVDTSSTDVQSFGSMPSSPSKGGANNQSLADFFGSDSSSQVTGATGTLRAYNSNPQKEKRRIGDLWLQQLVSSGSWKEAGKTAGKVLGTSSRWEHWVWTFAQADKFDEITPYIPATSIQPSLPSLVYEVILGHYIVTDAPQLLELLDKWDPELFDVRSVTTAIEDRLDSREVTESSFEDGIKGRDWRVLMEALAKLYLAEGRAREALRCYISLQDAEKAFSLMREEKLLDAVADDIPGLVMLRVSKEQLRSAPLTELEEASSEAVHLLVEEAHRGTIPTSAVVTQLQQRDDSFQPFLFFYFRALWKGASSLPSSTKPRRKFDRRVDEGPMLVNDHADLAVRLFAEYDRDLLSTFLKSSPVYSYDKAAEICERRHYIPELVHILSRTGQTKRALFLIIGELGDVSQAISFAKEHPDLWNDLLDYSMDKPSFIRGLLEEVGAAAAFNPIDVVRRIPEGLEIDGLKQGIQRLVREFEIQMSISEGVARVLRGEVSMGMDTLRAGRKKGVRFEVRHESAMDVDLAVHDVPTKVPGGEELPVPHRLSQAERRKSVEVKPARPGHCVGCDGAFHEEEKETLIGFACGHVYHLSCLLDANPDIDSKDANDLLNRMQTASEDGEDSGYGGRSVGGKVAHAHIIGSVVKGGCQRCVIPEGA